MLADGPLLRMLSLASSALPIGAFAHSQGLEWATHAGWVSDDDSAFDWISGTLLEVTARLDLPLSVRFAAAFRTSDIDRVGKLSRFLHAARESRELEEEDRHLGQALARVLEGHGVESAAPFRRDPYATFSALHALAATTWGIPERTALLGYAYSFCEAQAGALSRLLPIGQLKIQQLLFRLLECAPVAVDRALALADGDIGAFAPGHAIASMRHETQYTRLFRS